MQQRETDSLLKLVMHAPDDTLKVNRLINLSILQYNPKTTSTAFALQALDISKKLNYKPGIIRAFHCAGSACQVMKDYPQAIAYFKKAIDLSDETGYTSNNNNYYPPLLNLYFYLGDYPGAMETIKREMVLAEKTKDENRIAHCQNILGYIYFKQENYREAEKYYMQYMARAKSLNDSMMLAHACGEVADVYIAEKKYKPAISILQNTLLICNHLLASPGRLDTNFVYGWAPQYKAKALYRLGIAFELTDSLNTAKTYALEAIEAAKHQSMPLYDVALFHISAGNIFNQGGDYINAKKHLQFAYQLSASIQHRENTRDAAQSLSQTYEALHNYDSSLFFFKIYTQLKDSIVNNETKMKIAGIQGKYDIAEKDREIVRQQQIRNILIAGFSILLLLLALIYNGYRLKQKNTYQLEINRQQNELFNVIVNTQDQERKRIAQDIHDSLGSVLSAVKLKLSSLHEHKSELTANQLETYQTSLDLLDEAAAELRNISHNIMPATLSKLGLEAALKNLLDKINAHSKIGIHFSAFGFNSRIDEAIEMSIYRIVLELLNNIVKHAHAQKLSIQLIKYPTYINLVVEDNGIGFNHQVVAQTNKGIGLGNIQSRVEYLNGTMEIDSTMGKGTTVIIEIPCKAG